MSNLEEIAALLVKTWGTKTLEDFRVEAEHETNGTLFESLRADGGQRLIVVVCLTDPGQIKLIEDAVELVDNPNPEDWNALTLSTVAYRTAFGAGFGFESRRDDYGRRSALVLIAAEPRSMHIMETIFSLPK
jgi:hypothetical protein